MMKEERGEIQKNERIISTRGKWSTRMRAVMKEAEELCWGLENTTLGGEQGKQTGKGSWEGSAGGLINQGKSHVWRVVICNQGHPVRSRLISSINAARTREGRNDECEQLETGTSASRWNRWDLPGWSAGKEPACQCRRLKRCGFDPWVGRIPWRRKWQLTPVFLPGKFHGQKSLAGYSSWGHKESDTTEHAHTHTHIQMRAGANFENKNISKDFK